MKNAKKVLLLVLCAVLLVGASVMGTLAYLTSQDDVVNTFTVGKVEIKLDEAPVDDDGKKTEGARVQSNEYHLQPGLTYDKDPMVTVIKNSEDCYVRMFVTINNSADWDTIFAKYAGTENALSINSIFDINTGWTYKDNYEGKAGNDTRTYEFWYNAKVEKNTAEDTPLTALFTTIAMPDVLDNDDLALLADDTATEADESFKIYVVAQAIQSAGFADAEEAFGAAPKVEGNALVPAN